MVAMEATKCMRLNMPNTIPYRLNLLTLTLATNQHADTTEPMELFQLQESTECLLTTMLR